MSTKSQREVLMNYNRIVIKVGTSVVSQESGVLALGRLGALVEDISYLVQRGKQVLLVSSGSIGVGRNKLKHQGRLKASFRDHYYGEVNTDDSVYQAAAAAGQSGLMSIYDMCFGQFDISCAQVLVTAQDFEIPERKSQLRRTINTLLSNGVVPICNENDVLSTNPTVGVRNESSAFWDNDSLASVLARNLSFDLLILLTDVKGVYEKAPGGGEDRDRLMDPAPIPHMSKSALEHCQMTTGSARSRGGMFWKTNAAIEAINGGVRHAVIASGFIPMTLRRIMAGQIEGTLLGPVEEEFPSDGDLARQTAVDAKTTALNARAASRLLQGVSGEMRAKVLRGMADTLEGHAAEILAANEEDLGAAQHNGAPPGTPLYKRLALTEQKLSTLCEGLRQVADGADPLGHVLRRTTLADGLELEQVTAPLGVVLVIFESRPDVLPQISALAIRAGCGLVLKGGKEALKTNTLLARLVNDAAREALGHDVRDVVQLVRSREDVNAMLSLQDDIDLIIPRGSKQLVSSIRRSTNIPVLGHSDGVCHVLVDKGADMALAERVVIDAKTDYPAACNAAETLLLHRGLLDDKSAVPLLNKLRAAGIALKVGPQAQRLNSFLGLNLFEGLEETSDMSVEFGDLGMTVEVVESLGEAIEHINKYGSHHTDAIITQQEDRARRFQNDVDSACVFVNCSTRFADGFRFGLGAEVGISTGRIHARGPVGVEGLLSTKWKLNSAHEDGDTAADYSSGKRTFIHEHHKV